MVNYQIDCIECKERRSIPREDEGKVLLMLSYRDRIHKALGDLKLDPNHGPQLTQIIDAPCDGGSNQCGHACEGHDHGHHHEGIYVNGKKELICDPTSLEKLVVKLRAEVKACPDPKCKDEKLQNDIRLLEGLIRQYKDVKQCIKQMCALCLISKESKQFSLSRIPIRGRRR